MKNKLSAALKAARKHARHTCWRYEVYGDGRFNEEELADHISLEVCAGNMSLKSKDIKALEAYARELAHWVFEES